MNWACALQRVPLPRGVIGGTHRLAWVLPPTALTTGLEPTELLGRSTVYFRGLLSRTDAAPTMKRKSQARIAADEWLHEMVVRCEIRSSPLQSRQPYKTSAAPPVQNRLLLYRLLCLRLLRHEIRTRRNRFVRPPIRQWECALPTARRLSAIRAGELPARFAVAANRPLAYSVSLARRR